ncbi:MAG: tRNA (guanosine(46)-N7)-methyltransferase TrmB [Clostridia bacterium]|nr:tRNA (guanosine(46)-N7)-methyltransferase TrmB [Clostridia bacterium]
MRPRSKKHFEERYEAVSPLLVKEPETAKGRWRELFPQTGLAEREKAKLRLEIGCGKGAFISGMASADPNSCFVAMEVVPTVILMAMEKVWGDPVLREQDNVRFICGDARSVGDYFAENEVDAIYLNFSDPWPRPKQFKRRLTHPLFLETYKKILKPGGVIRQKTDNAPLFEFSLEQLKACGFDTRVIESVPPDNIITEYESRFVAEGLPIYRLEAVKPV